MSIPATSCCRTDCVERPLSRALRALGASVGAHPWPFLLLPVVLSGGLASGFHFLRLHHNIEGHFMPQRCPAKGDQRFVQTHFPTNDAKRFSAERLITKGTFASILVVVSKDRPTLLTPSAFAEMRALDRAVRRINTTYSTFTQLCARDYYGDCNNPNPLLSVMRKPGDLEHILQGLDLTFPLAGRSRLFLPPFLGGVVLGREGPKLARPVRAAKAARFFYYLQEDDAKQRNASDLWLQVFRNRIPDVLGSFHFSSIQVAYFTSLSIQEGFKRYDKLPVVYITYILIVFFSVLSCARLDCVRTKVWVAAFGVVSSAFSMVSSTGLLLFCKVPLVITLANAPFLILGVGLNDMFILVSCWQRTKVKDSVKDRMAETYAAAAVPITITALTNVLASCIGIATSFQSVQTFCVYTGTAFVFCYIYNLTFLGAILALNGKREESNRHWLTFMKVETEPQDSHGRVYNRCCIGGSFDESTGAEIEHPMDGFFRKHYGPFLMCTCTKVVVVVLYLLYLGSSIYGCIRVKEGIDVRNLASDDSYLIQYYDWKKKYFSEYGPRFMVVVTQSIAYWNSSVRADLEKCIRSIEDIYFVDKELSESWLRTYESVASGLGLNIDDKNFFIGNLSVLFKEEPTYQWDINHTATEIITSRFYLQVVNVTADNSILFRRLIGRAKKCKIPVIVYHPEFIYSYQYIAITYNTVQTIVIVTGAMLLISLLLIPNPCCSLLVTFAMVSVIVSVIGFMTFWHVNLNSVSMTYLIICIGFSVGFSAHVSYAFASSEEPKVNDKAVDALYRFGYPVVQGAVSTILGVAVLSMLDSYIFITFFKIMFLVILFGAVHGLIFIPVFLTFFDFCVGLANG